MLTIKLKDGTEAAIEYQGKLPGTLTRSDWSRLNEHVISSVSLRGAILTLWQKTEGDTYKRVLAAILPRQNDERIVISAEPSVRMETPAERKRNSEKIARVARWALQS
ncbi:MAG TPA: hypothetical protein VJI33_05105 [Candidatus Paceibacterota bacterium]